MESGGAIVENNVPFQICNGPFQISNGPQLWLVKLRASLCIDKYHFLGEIVGNWLDHN
jgi:hypothetical protein